MPPEESEQVVENEAYKKGKTRRPVKCPRCGGEYMKRLRRAGFMQARVYAIFGYYPWRCTTCLGDFMLKRRGSSRRHKEPQPLEQGAD